MTKLLQFYTYYAIYVIMLKFAGNHMKNNYQALREFAGGGNITLLFVDENEDTCKRLSPLLNYFFGHIDFAHSCKDALALFHAKHHTIVVTDIIFSHEDGYAFIKELKTYDAFQKIIILSSVLERKRIAGLINAFIYGYLRKPFKIEHLLMQLEKIAHLVHEQQMLSFYIHSLEASSFAPASSTKKQTATETNDDNFLFFDNTQRDEAIHRMHYKDDDKISAFSFFEKGLIEIETAQDLIIYSNELEEGVFLHAQLNEEYLRSTSDLVGIFANELELSGEFRDIAYALRGFTHTLSELLQENCTTLPAAKMIKTVIDAIIEDLTSWTLHVLVVRDAVDIHYLDASLLANTAQLDLSVKNLHHAYVDDDDEMEFF